MCVCVCVTRYSPLNLCTHGSQKQVATNLPPTNLHPIASQLDNKAAAGMCEAWAEQLLASAESCLHEYAFQGSMHDINKV